MPIEVRSLWPGGFVCAGMPFWDFMLISTAPARTEFAARKSQFRRHCFTGCRCVFRYELHFAWPVQGIRHMWRSVRNLSLRGRCGHFVKIVAGAVFCAKTAGVRHSRDCVLTWQAPGIHTMDPMFWRFGTWAWLRMILRRQCSISYDLGSWFRGRCSTSEVWFRKTNPLRRSWASSARNAGKVAFSDFEAQPFAEIARDAGNVTFSDFELQPSAEIARVHRSKNAVVSCVFWFPTVTLCGDRACPSRGMLVKLRLPNLEGALYKCSCRDPGAGILKERSCTRDPGAEILHKWSYRILLHTSWQRSCTRDPHTEILHKWSYKILMQRSCHRDLAQEIAYRDLAQVVIQDPDAEILPQRSCAGDRIQRSCTSGHTRSWCRNPATEILRKRSHTEILQLAQVVLHHPDADILTERSCTRDPHTEVLQKWSYKILMQRSGHTDKHKRSAYRDLAQVFLQDPAEVIDTDILHKRSAYTNLAQVLLHTGSCWGNLGAKTLHKISSYGDLAQEVLHNPDAKILAQRSCARDPQTEILRKWSSRILVQRSWQRDLRQEIRIHRSCTSAPTGSCWWRRRSWHKHFAQEILIQRSCIRGPTGHWCRDPDTEILRKRLAHRDLAHVVLQDPAEEVLTQASCARDSHTPILHKWPRGSWYRDPHTVLLHKWSYYRILVQRSRKRDLGQEIRIQRFCTSGPRGCWCRDPNKDILQKWCYRILMERSWHGLGIHYFRQRKHHNTVWDLLPG